MQTVRLCFMSYMMRIPELHRWQIAKGSLKLFCFAKLSFKLNENMQYEGAIAVWAWDSLKVWSSSFITCDSWWHSFGPIIQNRVWLAIYQGPSSMGLSGWSMKPGPYLSKVARLCFHSYTKNIRTWKFWNLKHTFDLLFSNVVN